MAKQLLYKQSWTFQAIDTSLKSIRDDIRSYLTHSIGNEEVVDNVIIAVNEACMNIIQHAYHGLPGEEIEIDLFIYSQLLEIIIKDNAEPVNFKYIVGRDLHDVRPGGLGVNFIKEIMDEVIYEHREDKEGNMITLRKVVTF